MGSLGWNEVVWFVTGGIVAISVVAVAARQRCRGQNVNPPPPPLVRKPPPPPAPPFPRRHYTEAEWADKRELYSADKLP